MVAEIVAAFGGVAALLLIVGWLIRSLLAHLLSKDVEGFKQRLQAQSSLELVRLNHDLCLIAAEHEKRVHLLQEQRAKTIAELYEKLIDFLDAAESFSTQVEFGTSNKEVKAQTLAERAAALWAYFRTHRIYFTEDTCARVDGLFREVQGPMMSFRSWTARAEKSEAAIPKMDDAWDAAWETMQNKVPPLRSAIEAEFRELLGVTPAVTLKG